MSSASQSHLLPGWDDLHQKIEDLSALRRDAEFKTKRRLIYSELLEIVGGMLFSIFRRYHFDAEADFYYWPGYASFLDKERVSLNDESTGTVTGIGYQVKNNEVGDPYRMNRSAIWFSRALTQQGGSFVPGSTHNWLMCQDLRLQDIESRAKLILHVFLARKPFAPHHEHGVLSVPLDPDEHDTFGQQLARVLNDPKLNISGIRWPYAPDATSLRVRVRLYDLWLGATFSPNWMPTRDSVNSLASDLKLLKAEGIAEEIAKPDTTIPLPENHYSHWYSLAIKYANDELGTAMFFTSHKLAHGCITEFRRELTAFYHSWRLAELTLAGKDVEGSPIEVFLDQISQCKHADCSNKTDRARNALAALLSFSRKELDELLENRAYGQFFEAMKNLGIDTIENNNGIRSEADEESRIPVSALGGWLIALGAYRALWPDEKWGEVFDIANLNTSVRDRKMSPPQGPLKLRETIQSLFNMFGLLFRFDEHNEDPGAIRRSPLKRVSLDEHGLAFTLSFDCMKPSGLVQRLNERCEQISKLQPATRSETSQAIWDFLLRTQFSDDEAHLLRDGLWSGYWRLNIKPKPDRKNTIVYFR